MRLVKTKQNNLPWKRSSDFETNIDVIIGVTSGLCNSVRHAMPFSINPIPCFPRYTWAHLVPRPWLLGPCLHTLETASIFHGARAGFWHGFAHTQYGGNPSTQSEWTTFLPLLGADDPLPCGMQDRLSPLASWNYQVPQLTSTGELMFYRAN